MPLLYRASSTNCSTSCPSFTAAANLTGKLPLHLHLAQTAWEWLGSEMADLPQRVAIVASAAACSQPAEWRQEESKRNFPSPQRKLCFPLSETLAVSSRRRVMAVTTPCPRVGFPAKYSCCPPPCSPWADLQPLLWSSAQPHATTTK